MVEQHTPPSFWLLLGIMVLLIGGFVGVVVLLGKLSEWRAAGGSLTGLVLRRAPQLQLDTGRSARQVAPPTANRPPATGHRPLTTTTPPAPATPVELERNWLGELIDGFHVLVVGGTRGGKTVLAHHIAIARSLRGHQVLVGDPDARPGMWPGCTVAGGGDDWPAINGLIAQVQQLIAERRQLRASGQRSFPPVTVVLSEASYILAECPDARATMEDGLRRGAKLGINILMDVQDSQTKTLGIEGQSALLINLVRVEVAKIFGQRLATVHGVTYEIPDLVDPEQLADAYDARQPARADVSANTPAAPAAAPAIANEARTSSEASTASEREKTAVLRSFSPRELAEMTARIIANERLDKPVAASEMAKRMPGYQGKLYPGYKALYDELKAGVDAIGEEAKA